MNNYKFVSFDVEIERPLPPGDNEWKNYRPLGISCASVILEGEDPQVFYHGMEQGVAQGGAMNADELKALYNCLALAVAGDYTLLTWNGMGFDFDVLQEELGPEYFDSVRDMAWFTHVDMMLHFLCMKGYPLGLEAASLGMGLSGKTEGMNGALAPLLWHDDPIVLELIGEFELAKLSALRRRELVLGYVQQDTRLTLDVGRRIEAEGCVRWTSQKGRPMQVDFPEGWLTVSEALRLPLPDTAWMDVPMTRERFYSWTGLEPLGPRELNE